MAPPGGSTISDRYELGERLGSGGMSTVYGATDRVLERTVAVKILAEHLSDDEKFVARFRREALAVARLIHPNIVQVYDTGVDHDRHYIVMEYVEGRSVAQLLQRRGRLGPEVAVSIGVQSCAGLEYAHRQGIIHRDVKPGNLMVIGGPAGRPSTAPQEPATDEMTVKLTDFGIARAAEQTRLTQVGSVVGTAAYLAPEQARGGEATPAADVYALGVVIYQMLTARLPWEGSSLAELATRRESESPLPPSSYDSSVPETLSTAVLRALEGDVADRYTSAKELSAALRAGISGREPPVASDEAPTQALMAGGLGTAATRAMDSPDIATPVSPEPVYRPPRRAAPVPAPAPVAQQKPSGGSRFLRFMGVLFLIAVLAAIIAVVVLVATDAGQNTEIGNAISDEINEQIDRLEDLIRDNQ
ncbi:MAG TPA: protein kinase [Solirubrobacterales bacterium]|nr:protein kinase [Solirubrobacterales bacterium]